MSFLAPAPSLRVPARLYLSYADDLTDPPLPPDLWLFLGLSSSESQLLSLFCLGFFSFLRLLCCSLVECLFCLFD